MTRQEYIKEYVQRVEKRLNERKDVYELSDYTECEYCPLTEGGKCCIIEGMSPSCTLMLKRNIDDMSEIEKE